MKRRWFTWTAAALLALSPLVHAQGEGADPQAPRKILRVAFGTAETSFDPTQISDLYSRTVTAHIFEGLYRYDHLHRPAKFRPLIAEAMPEVSPDYRTFTIRLRKGIHFADDPVFKGQPREVTAPDFVYAFKRFADPALKSQVWSYLETFKIKGLSELRDAAMKSKKPFEYDREIEGVRALDRHTLQFKVVEPRPRLVEMLALSDLFGAVAREVVEHYGQDIGAHPVGTGPFRLKQWRRSSLIVLERNPNFRDERYDEQPAADDAAGQAILAKLKGRRIPLVDEVHISIIEEQQPRWLSFLNAQIDTIAGQYGAVPAEFITTAMPNGQLAPNLAKQGIQAHRQVNSDVTMFFFNMEDPLVGGYTPEKVALRRAISLGMDVDRWIRLLGRGQGVPAQSGVVPHTTGYDPQFKSENGDYDVPRAKALLDLYGYVDRNGDGWRDQPDGSPLVLQVSSQSDQNARQQQELLKRDLNALGLQVNFLIAKWPEQLKQARAGKLMIWSLGSSAAGPDGQGSLQRLDGTQVGGQNLARFRRPEFDRIYEQLSMLPDGPERESLFLQAKRIAVTWMPYKSMMHRVSTDMLHPWVSGYRRPLFWQEWWHFVDVDPEMRREKTGKP